MARLALTHIGTEKGKNHRLIPHLRGLEPLENQEGGGRHAIDREVRTLPGT